MRRRPPPRLYQLRPQTLQLGVEFALGFGGIGRGDKRTGLEVAIAKGLAKPDGKFSSHLQLVQGLAAVAGVLMGSFVAGFAQTVE